MNMVLSIDIQGIYKEVDEKSELLFWVNLPKRINDLKFWNQMKPGPPSLIHINPLRRVTAGWHLSWTNLRLSFSKKSLKLLVSV